jgi:uncharacterized protein (TIGR02996 family)
MTDDDFLQAILEKPDEEAPLLVYADWLEEQGDVRAELIRVQQHLAGMKKRERGRARLEARLRELRCSCPEDWLIALDQRRWMSLYLRLTGSKGVQDPFPNKKRVRSAIRKFETDFGVPLPRSYKAYSLIFGPGEFGSYFRINVPDGRKLGDLAGDHHDIHDWEHGYESNQGQLLRRIIYFSNTIGGELIGWDPSAVRDSGESEYAIFHIERTYEAVEIASSFPEFISEICLGGKLGDFIGGSGWDDPEQSFFPYRQKKQRKGK